MCLLVCPGAMFPLEDYIGIGTLRTPYMDMVKVNEKARVYILASMYESGERNVNLESLATAKEVMDSLRKMFGELYFTISFEEFCPFQMKVSLNKIELTLTTLLNELQRFQNLTMVKENEVEANIATRKS
ncbi:gag/pol protein [Cucumis melo var. makuwa]|uniref:Gag/pol protein n=1 Tax=Cucumis melo var. makuwa TaxID=1194695 RepID=A0A5A7SZZ6_CUCMM|nr:gag/pol protein [Cucumis melo var. makuwa]TYK31015.1 gag/pol protein [Cucumis melo var. makuwa]